jgi:hypothetical protein
VPFSSSSDFWRLFFSIPQEKFDVFHHAFPYMMNMLPHHLLSLFRIPSLERLDEKPMFGQRSFHAAG